MDQMPKNDTLFEEELVLVIDVCNTARRKKVW